MSAEREQMQGRLASLREKKKKLELKIDGNAEYIRQSLNTVLTPAAELEIPLLDEQWDDLKTTWIDLHIVLDDIARLEKALR